jgi:glycosyltransferase involved in cell wall biosynthesis
MKIVYITNTISGAGGLQRVLLLKAGYLADIMGYNVTIITTNPNPRDYLFYDISELIKCITISPKKTTKILYFVSYRKLVNKALDAIDPDVVVMCDNGLKSLLLPFILAKRKPLVFEWHVSKEINYGPSSFYKNFQSALIRKFMNFCAKRFDRFVVLTSKGAKEWNLKNLVVISNPLWFKTDELSSLYSKKAIAVGRHSPEKGYKRMFIIWKQVIDKHPDWVLDVYGDNNPDYDIEQIAIDCGLTRGINFLPPTTAILDVYKNASIYLMTSHFEGFGMVLLEAMACGVPCVAFNCPVGPAEIISDKLNGFLIEDGNTDAFLNAVIGLIEDKDLRLKIGAEAKKSSEAYNIDAIMQQWDTLFKSLL